MQFRRCVRASLRVLYFAAAHLHRRRSPPRRVPRARDGTPATGVFSGYKLCRGGEGRRGAVCLLFVGMFEAGAQRGGSVKGLG